MRLNATTAATTTRLKSTTTTATGTTTTKSTKTLHNIEYFVCNLIQLFVLTTTIICTASAIDSGLLQAQAQSHSETAEGEGRGRGGAAVETGLEGGDSMDAFSGQFDELSQPKSSPMLAVPATASAATAATFQFSTVVPHTHTHAHHNTHLHAHTHSHAHTHTHTPHELETATTLRVSYDSNEIDNSYAVAGEAAAALNVDVDVDVNVDDVEVVDDDYVMALGQLQNTTTNEKTDRPTNTTTTTTTATTTLSTTTTAVGAELATASNEKQLINAKTQDLLSLSQLSSHQTSTAPLEKSSSSLKNSIGVGTSSGGNFQQIGSQRVNGNVLATSTTSTQANSNSQQVTLNGTSISPTLSTVRNSAKKVESKYVQKTDAPMLNYIFDTFSAANKHHHHDQRYGPHFEDVQRVGQPTNITVQAGSSVHLNCRISLLQDKTVSWVRRSAQNEENALDLLTVGLHAYTGDKRYKMEFQYPNNWRLKIINVKKDDEATYECQISTHPPRVLQINLHVNAPKVMIVDEYGDPLQEKYYEIDSTLQLFCVVRNVAMSSSVVFWKHSDNVLNYDVTRGGVSVKTDLMDDGANSSLSIVKINKADSGNYTCSISEFQNFTIVVHILNGESFAELHHGGASSVPAATWQYIIGIYILLMFLRWMQGNCR